MLRLSVSTKKSCDSLREWGANQVAGEDLNDVLSKVSFLFEQLGKAQAKFAEHLQTYRSHFKDLRAREENYLALRRARDALQAKIDSADKQLAKTGAEHKDRLTVCRFCLYAFPTSHCFPLTNYCAFAFFYLTERN